MKGIDAEMVQHRDGGQVFNFDLLSRPESDPTICQRGGPYGHRSGYDTFSACLNVQRSGRFMSRLTAPFGAMTTVNR